MLQALTVLLVLQLLCTPSRDVFVYGSEWQVVHNTSSDVWGGTNAPPVRCRCQAARVTADVAMHCEPAFSAHQPMAAAV